MSTCLLAIVTRDERSAEKAETEHDECRNAKRQPRRLSGRHGCQRTVVAVIDQDDVVDDFRIERAERQRADRIESVPNQRLFRLQL